MAILSLRNLFLLLSATSTFLISPVNANPLHRRAVIAHDAVVGFPQAVPGDAAGAAALKFKPWLDVRNGCVPFPAVDALGNTG